MKFQITSYFYSKHKLPKELFSHLFAKIPELAHKFDAKKWYNKLIWFAMTKNRWRKHVKLLIVIGSQKFK